MCFWNIITNTKRPAKLVIPIFNPLHHSLDFLHLPRAKITNLASNSPLGRGRTILHILGTKTWHFECPNKNSETTFINPTSLKNDGIDFSFNHFPLLDGFSAISKYAILTLTRGLFGAQIVILAPERCKKSKIW